MAPNKIAIATNALGKSIAGHAIPRKLQAAHDAGFDGIEVAIECVEDHANTFSDQYSTRADRMRAAAQDIYSRATELSLSVIALCPFAAYDALNNEVAVAERLIEADLWLQLCCIMKAPILQIPSCTYPISVSKTSPDPTVVAANLRRLCLLAQSYDIDVAYEAVAWGLHISRWQEARDVVSLVDLPNMKLCLDTYHIAAREVGDPFNQAAPVRRDLLPSLASSLTELRETVLPRDIGYVQLSDSTVADPEQRSYPARDLEQPPFMTQSRNCRMFPAEPERYGGTLPAVEVAEAIFATGYRGWVSMEVFHVDLYDPLPSTPDEWARRGMASWKEVVRRCGLGVETVRKM